MIFVTLGSQKFQFNRLLKEIDKLIDEGKIAETVFAQIGYSDYKPKNYEYKEFLDREEFTKIMKQSDKVITHGGTGAIITAVKNNKKVIAVPRLEKYGEHVDNHQIEITNQFKKMNLIDGVKDINSLYDSIKRINEMEFKKYVSNTNTIITNIDNYIKSM